MYDSIVSGHMKGDRWLNDDGVDTMLHFVASKKSPVLIFIYGEIGELDGISKFSMTRFVCFLWTIQR